MQRMFIRTLMIAALGIVAATHNTSQAQDVRQNVQRIRQAGPRNPPSGLIGFLASPLGRVLLRHTNHPMLRALAARLGEPSGEPDAITPEAAAAPTADTVVAGCGTASGTRFN